MRGLFALYMVKIAHVFGHFINVKLVPVVIRSGNGRQIMKTICKLNIEENDSQKEPEIKNKKKRMNCLDMSTGRATAKSDPLFDTYHKNI